MKYKFFFAILLYSNLVVGQNYAWPTKTGKQLTSNFGEFRGDHFHMGLDIRTHASEGHSLFAISDGYIYRINTNFGGCGKSIYLKTVDDKIVLYCHLTKYSKKLESRLFDLQNDNQSYFVNQHFTEDEYPVKKGEIIGYSGNSGGSMGPHLHFELRNDNNQPLNPLTNGFSLNDTVPPIFLDLAIIPLDKGTQINNSSIPCNYVPVQLSQNNFTLNDTISIHGDIGFATRIIDKIQKVRYSYQINKLDLYVDSIPTFSVKYELLDFSERKYISTVYGQPVNHPKSDDFQKLYKLDNYPSIKIHSENQNGVLNLPEGLHKVDIVAHDAVQNKSTLSFYINVNKTKRNSKQFKLLKMKEYATYSKNVNPDIIVLEKGAVFQLQTELDKSEIAAAFIENNDVLFTFPLYRDNDKYFSDLLNLNYFDESTNSGFLFYSDSVCKYDFSFLPKLIPPETTNTVFSIDSLVSININDSFYDTTLLWITEQSELSNSYHKNRISDVYEISPKGIPLKNKIEVTFNFKDEQDLRNSAVYKYSKKKSKWNYITSKIDSNKITTKLNKPEILTVIKDTKPPWFNYTFPKNSITYTQDSLKNIKIILDDNLSGINLSEKILQVYLDGKRLWITYQPVKKEITYEFKNILSIGEHNLKINIQDRSGNSATKSIKFFIK